MTGEETAMATTGKIELDRLLRMFRSGTLLGALRPSWRYLGGHRLNTGAAQIRVAPLGLEKSPLGALLGRSCALKGRYLSSFGSL